MDKFLTWIRKLQGMPKRYLGVLIGIACWILIELVGFFPTLLLVVLAAIGYGLGRFFDDRADWQEIIQRIWQSDHYDR